MTDSARDFKDRVWPIVQEYIGGTIEPVEGVTDDHTARKLDILAGVDAWHYVDDGGGMRGIASRVQWGSTIWRTFTVRRSVPSGRATEYAKRLYAIENPSEGLLFPHYTVQAYLNCRGGRVGAVAYIPTKELILHIRDNGADWRDAPGGQTFYYVPWGRLESFGTNIVILEPRSIYHQ